MSEPTIEERDLRCPFCDLLLAECACEDLSEDDEESLDDFDDATEDEHDENCDCIKCAIGWDEDEEEEED